MANVYIYLWVQRYKIMLTLENNVGEKENQPRQASVSCRG